MYKQKIGISLANKHDMSFSELLPLLKQIGFDAVSPTWETREELIEITRVAKEIGLEVQSLHAPIQESDEDRLSLSEIQKITFGGIYGDKG